MGRFVRFGLVLAALAALSGCASLGVGSAGGNRPAASPQTLDVLGDDVASAVIVLDLPGSLEPVPGASIVAFKLTAKSGDIRRIDAQLAPADAEAAMAALPPPAADRTYYLFGFSSKDQQKLREAQTWGRGQPAGTVDVQVDLLPALCATEDVDQAATRFSVLSVVRGTALVPLMSSVSVADMVKARNRPLERCAGHSG